MTSRDRITLALNHKQPDRTPLFEYVFASPMADSLLGHKYVSYELDQNIWEDFVVEVGLKQALFQYVSDRLEIAKKLDHDMLYVCPNPIYNSDNKNDGSKDVLDKMLQEKDDPVEVVKIKNKLKQQEPDDVKEDSLFVYSYLFEEMEKRGMDLPVMAPAYAHGVWNDVELMQTMILDYEVAHEHFKLASKKIIPYINKFLQLGIEQIGIGGDFSGNRPMISPDSYRRFIVPELKILSDIIHQQNGWAINASDGNLWPVIDDFLLESGVDGYLEIDMRAGMDLKKLKSEYGNDITFYGNMDCGELLSFGAAESIRKETIECLENGLGNGGHIFTASNAITRTVSKGNYLTMLNTYREYFDLPEIIF